MDSTQHKEGSAIEKMIEYLNGLLKIEDDLILTNSKNEDAVKDIKENWQQLNMIKEMALTIQKKYTTPPTGNERTAEEVDWDAIEKRAVEEFTTVSIITIGWVNDKESYVSGFKCGYGAAMKEYAATAPSK